MGTIWVKEFTGGLDARRLPETTPGGVLIRAKDGHVTRGGEFEKRAAFVPSYTLPAKTFGLAHDAQGLVVFGSIAAPAQMPVGVRYERLEHPDGRAMAEILSHDLYDGKLYVSARYTDGSVYHFYDGDIVTDWFDGRARASFKVIGGTASDEMTNLTVGGVSVFTSPVDWTTSNAATAAAIAAEINSNVSTPEYTASAVGSTVNIIAAAQGTAANGLAVVATVTGAFEIDPAEGLTMARGDTAGGSTATGSFRVTSGVPGATILVAVDGVNLTSAPVTCGANNGATAAAIAAAIRSHASTPDYTAQRDGTKVVITTADKTGDVNGLLPTFTFTGLPSSGGTKASASFTITGVSISDWQGSPSEGLEVDVTSTLLVSVNGVNLTAAPTVANDVAAGDTPLAERFATAIAAAITAHVSSPDYTATATGATVTVTTTANSDDANGFTFDFAIEGIVVIGDAGTFAGGSDPLPAGTAVSEVVAFSGGKADDAFIPGDFVRTVKSKMYSTAGSILHFSGIAAPTEWTTDAPGAGFINMATQNSGSERLTAVSRYQNLLAVFSPEVVQVWFVDPDPNLNTQSQVLLNTGTDYPLSVTQFGDSDVFYLDNSGLRSLRARDSSNSASTTDIGVPVDDLITAKVRTLTPDQKRHVAGLINPLDKRFWLIVKDEIFVFSFFQNAKVSAWTTYSTTAKNGTDEIAFDAEHVTVFNQRPFIRSGDVIFCYGGVDQTLVYDETQAEAWLPYLDGNRPTAHKSWTALDVALTGLWEIKAAMQPTDLTAEQVVARAYQTTYNMHRIPFEASSSHVSLRLVSSGTGPAVLSAAAIHFSGNEDET